MNWYHAEEYRRPHAAAGSVHLGIRFTSRNPPSPRVFHASASRETDTSEAICFKESGQKPMTYDDALKDQQLKRDERLRRRQQERDKKVISIFTRMRALPVDRFEFRRLPERAEPEQSRVTITPL